MDDLRFIFDGKDSQDFGLNIIKISSGFYPTPYISGQNIIEEIIPNKHENYFFGVKKHPFQFDITFSLLDEEFTHDKKIDLAKWLIHDEYKMFQSYDDFKDNSHDALNKFYYVIATNQADFMSGGTNKGYFTLTFRTNAPWAYSRVIKTSHDCSGITEPFIFKINNRSNVLKYYYPEIEIQVGSSEDNIELINLTDNNREFIFTDVEAGEIIYIDNNRHKIFSNKDAEVYSRLGNFNKGWLRLKQGVNKIQVNTKCKIKTRCQFPLLG